MKPTSSRGSGATRLLALLVTVAAALVAAQAQAAAANEPRFVGTPSCGMTPTKLISCTARVVGLAHDVQAFAFLGASAEWICPSNLGIGGHAASGVEQVVPIQNGRQFAVSWQVPSQPAYYSYPPGDNTCTAGWKLEAIVASLQIYQPLGNYILGYAICDPAYGAACLLYWDP